jgi:transcription-repair coupling factor (superfamily II helicase)
MILPHVSDLLARLGRHPSVDLALESLRRGEKVVRLAGLTEPAKALLAAQTVLSMQRPGLLVVDSDARMERMAEMAGFFLRALGAKPGQDVCTLPSWDVLPWQGRSPHPEIAVVRATALWRMATGRAALVILSVTAARTRLQEATFYAELASTLARGEAHPLEELIAHLVNTGYERHETVEMPGHFAVRGGILDVFSPEATAPVRLEFFGDTVESLREFDPNTQRSVRQIERTTLLPLNEISRRGELLEQLIALRTGFRPEEQNLAGTFPGWEFEALRLEAPRRTLMDVAGDAMLLLDEPQALAESWKKFEGQLQEAYEDVRTPGKSGGEAAPPEHYFLWGEEWEAASAEVPRLELEELVLESGDTRDAAQPLVVKSQPTLRYHGNVAAFMSEVRERLQNGEQAIACAANTGEMERLADLCHEYELAYQLGEVGEEATLSRLASESSAGSLPAVTLVKAPLREGVCFPELHLIIYGSNDLFETLPAEARVRRRPKAAAFTSDFSDLRPGDYVVHVDHGIGQFEGLRQLGTDGAAAEFMLLKYADDARLYVPLARLDLVQKYRSFEGAVPQLDRLGGTAWATRKQRVRRSVTELAERLLKLYAERKAGEGYAYPPDSAWQREFEDGFEFEETPDQLRAIEEIKRDMQSPTPMDRLLCGDVGYGKTEVAMRAAFRAVNDSRQVAVLAPTTVLVFQHFETFRRRFAPFPVRIEMLSRFLSAREQKRVLAELEAGKVDIIIGTHRLLSRDVRFHDLGLLIVDEEQRFGVAHKERIKEMRRNVDVLTMSATPIPRTLHMSLVGLRDMSLIETPPKDRLAIQTVVAPFSERLVQTAIEAELAREGQVYLVHNRVESIYSMASLVQRLVPRARVVVGHGQMPEKQLEAVMLKFVRHEADVLVSTSIIENGLDIPRANTIIINRADRFGLSELYQLRGRVGRSNQRASAYLLVPNEGALSEMVRKRLAALREFSELGAGFRIAALDLELRGAGNLLGAEQHGHVNSIGFDLYTQMLERAVAELKGEAPRGELRTTLNLGLDIRIPPEYVPSENLRLRTYKRIAGVTTEAEREEVARELEDRFGPLPRPVANLLEYAVLKGLGEKLGIASIERKGDQIAVKFHEETTVSPERVVQVVRGDGGRRLDPAGVLWLKVERGAREGEGVIEQVRKVLLQLQV